MFAGHLAAGLVLKKVERRLNLGWLFFAGLFHDFLFGIFVLLGVEQIHIPINYAETHYLNFTFPYSHSLAASIVWSLLGFGIAYVFVPRKWTTKEQFRAASAIGLAVFSHFVFDWIVHTPDLPLMGDNSLKIGLGLWDHLALGLLLEAALVAIGFAAYLILIKPKTNLSRYGLGALLLFTTAMTVLGMWLTETPPPASGAAISWILQPFLVSGVAIWLDKKA